MRIAKVFIFPLLRDSRDPFQRTRIGTRLLRYTEQIRWYRWTFAVSDARTRVHVRSTGAHFDGTRTEGKKLRFTYGERKIFTSRHTHTHTYTSDNNVARCTVNPVSNPFRFGDTRARARTCAQKYRPYRIYPPTNFVRARASLMPAASLSRRSNNRPRVLHRLDPSRAIPSPPPSPLSPQVQSSHVERRNRVYAR